MTESPPPAPDGRSLGWRLGAFGLGALFAAAGVALVWRPALLAYGVAGVLGGLALLCVVSSIAARGR